MQYKSFYIVSCLMLGVPFYLVCGFKTTPPSLCGKLKCLHEYQARSSKIQYELGALKINVLAQQIFNESLASVQSRPGKKDDSSFLSSKESAEKIVGQVVSLSDGVATPSEPAESCSDEGCCTVRKNQFERLCAVQKINETICTDLVLAACCISSAGQQLTPLANG